MDPVFFGARRGWVEVVTGVMFSGKSEELIRRVRRSIIAKKSVQIFKSHLDDRYGGVFSISSHDGRIVEAIPVDSSLRYRRISAPTQVSSPLTRRRFPTRGST